MPFEAFRTHGGAARLTIATFGSDANETASATLSNGRWA
jgi:hypothetical protein